MSDLVQHKGTILSFNSSDSWVILSPIEQNIKRKIEAVGTPLKNWGIQINYGIKTGFNDAFIISTETRDEILSKCKDEDERIRTEEIIRPILRGRDIKKYGYDWAGLWLIWIPWHFPYHLDESIKGASEKAEQAFKTQFPAIYNYLYQYKEQLSARNKAETGIRYEWYALQRWGANYWDDFLKPKIAWPSVGATEYSLIPEGYILLDTNYFLTCTNPLNLLAFLNSSLIVWWINSEDSQLGRGGAWRHYKYNLEKLCVPYNHKGFEDEINRILSSHNYNDKESIEIINKKVFELYNLDEEEIRFIQSQYIQ